MANGKYLPANNPIRIKRDQAIGEERLKGATYSELCKQFNLNTSTICHILHTDTAAKEVLETGTREMIARLPLAIQNYDEFLHPNKQPVKDSQGVELRDKDGNVLLVEAPKDKELREKVSTNIVQGLGILGTRTPMNVQNIYIDQRTTITPVMATMLGQGDNTQDSNDIIDIEE